MRPQQQRIIAALRVQSQIDVAQEMERSITFLTDYLQQHSGLTTLVLGISGGQYSTPSQDRKSVEYGKSVDQV